MASVRAFMVKLPGFFLSSYSQTAYFSGAFVSIDTYNRLLADINQFAIPVTNKVNKNGEEEVLYQPATAKQAYARCYVKMVKDSNDKQREDTMNGLRFFLTSDFISIQDTVKTVQIASTATNMLLLFFNVVAAVALLLCFFVLWLSFTANMRENSWELGVLRALGLSFDSVVRAYIYEGSCVILSALILGTIIGLLVAVTLTAQFNLFTELPFNFQFPSTQFISVLFMTAFALFGGTLLPAQSFKKKPIANLIKGL
jgi:ABC-type antimicrobial peptide transport system permease subunit